MSKYIFVTSGVCSGLGKGVASSTIGTLLENSGLKIAMVKCDPYINVDAGNISPYQHGEVYVTEDGYETDIDFGNFARFTNSQITRDDCLTIGKIYENVIRNERAGRYNGRTVQVIPHITDEIKRCIRHAAEAKQADVVIVEIGGTVGDIEAVPYLEAERQLIRELGKTNALSLHLALIPVITGGELKSKPMQTSVKHLQEFGIQPDILLCRCEVPVDPSLAKKIALFCNVSVNAVFSSTDVEKSIYELPLNFHAQKLDKCILEKLALDSNKTDISSWENFINKLKNPSKKVRIGMIEKKEDFSDFYKSVRESLFHAALTGNDAELEIVNIDAETLEEEKEIASYFKNIDGVVIPGNYGQRGFIGLLKAVKYVRENKIPFLGIDLGMQLMAIESARTLCGWEDADTTEFVRNTTHPVISLPEEQSGSPTNPFEKVGTYDIKIYGGTKLHEIYNSDLIKERHRSKYCFDNQFKSFLSEKGLIVSAISPVDSQTEAFEWIGHPFGIGVQYHPEFISKPLNPHPLFNAFIRACLK